MGFAGQMCRPSSKGSFKGLLDPKMILLKEARAFGDRNRDFSVKYEQGVAVRSGCSLDLADARSPSRSLIGHWPWSNNRGVLET